MQGEFFVSTDIYLLLFQIKKNSIFLKLFGFEKPQLVNTTVTCLIGKKVFDIALFWFFNQKDTQV